MAPVRPGHHGQAAFTALPARAPDADTLDRRWDVEESAFMLLGGTPTSSFYADGSWHVVFLEEPTPWFQETFGNCHEAVFRAVPAQGRDCTDGIAFERVK